MPSKRTLVVLLAGVNLLLLLMLVWSATGLPAARAQAVSARPGDFVAVTADSGSGDSDALFLVDVPKHQLHVFIPEGPQTRKLVYIGYRDLLADFLENK